MRVAQSSHIQAHDYDPESKTMTIQFTNGAVYHYSGVPETEYYNFAQSPSPGAYFWSKMRGNYNDSMIAPGPANSSGRRRR